MRSSYYIDFRRKTVVCKDAQGNRWDMNDTACELQTLSCTRALISSLEHRGVLPELAADELYIQIHAYESRQRGRR